MGGRILPGGESCCSKNRKTRERKKLVVVETGATIIIWNTKRGGGRKKGPRVSAPSRKADEGQKRMKKRDQAFLTTAQESGKSRL